MIKTHHRENSMANIKLNNLNATHEQEQLHETRLTEIENSENSINLSEEESRRVVGGWRINDWLNFSEYFDNGDPIGEPNHHIVEPANKLKLLYSKHRKTPIT